MLKQMANLIFNILVVEAGVYEGIRDQFVDWFCNGHGEEFRIGGINGFGSKFWKTRDKMYINCYQEDEKLKSKRIIRKVNKILEGIILE